MGVPRWGPSLSTCPHGPPKDEGTSRALRDPAIGVCRNLDYYCRLDTDSRINAPVPIDMFEYMATNGLHYGFVERSTEQAHLAEGMW